MGISANATQNANALAELNRILAAQKPLHVVDHSKEIAEIRRALAAQVIDMFGEGKKDSLQAIAADVVLPMIENDVIAEDITTLLLEEVPTEVGDIKWAKKPTHTAHFIDENGNYVASHDVAAFITPAARTLTCEPVLNKLDMRRGHVSSIEDQAEIAKDSIVKSRNSEVINMMIAAADATMSFTNPAVLDKATLDAAITAGEDRGWVPKLLVMRGTRGGDIKDLVLPQSVSADLVTKGVQAVQFSGANPMYSVDMPLANVLVIFDKKAGRVMTEFPLEEEEVQSAGGMKIKLPMFTTYRAAVTNPFRFALITIT